MRLQIFHSTVIENFSDLKMYFTNSEAMWFLVANWNMILNGVDFFLWE